VLLQSLLNPQFSGVIANTSQSTVFWCYCKPFSIHSFLVLLQSRLNPHFSGVIANTSQSTVFWCYCKAFSSTVSFLVLLQTLLNPQFSGVTAKPSQSTVLWCYLQILLNPQFSGVIVTTYSGTHSNFTIGRARGEMKEVCWLTESNLSQIQA
jgi:hypothetical protein